MSRPSEYLRGLAPPRPTDDEWPNTVLVPEWWERRKVLSLTRAWAVYAGIPPELLLGHVLALTALAIPREVHLPPIIGGPAPINFGVVLVAPTGMGKTLSRLLHRHAVHIGGAVAHTPPHRTWPLGTGQGITDALLGTDTNEHGHRLPHNQPVLIYADEGRKLDALIERQGSTLAATLCSAISGADLGDGNADKGLFRQVDAGTYRLAVVFGVQPKFVDGVLADVDGGLPQRFAFLLGTGYHLCPERPRRPDERISVAVPEATAAPIEETFGTRCVEVPPWMTEEVWQAHVERFKASDRGESVAGSSHRMLLRLRVAVLLAALEHHYKVDEEDWALASAFVDVSDAVVAMGAAERARRAAERERAETERAVRHAVAAAEGIDSSRVARVKKNVIRLVRQNHGITRKELRKRVWHKDRKLVDEAIDSLIIDGVLCERSEPGQGEAKRALYMCEKGS